MPNFHHYTDDEGAESIIRSGTIQASLRSLRNGDAAFGNGVYLTKLSPHTSSKDEIAMNNWTTVNAATKMKLKNYFVISIPEIKVKASSAVDRNIFLFGKGHDLRLHKYPWVLKDYDSHRIIASYKYEVSSSGDALGLHSASMGNYLMTDDVVNWPVYTKSSKRYLFVDNKGHWIVGFKNGGDTGHLGQKSRLSLGPDQNIPWNYLSALPTPSSPATWIEDETLGS